MLVTTLEAHSFRSLGRLRVDLRPGITAVVGPNGTGKTNLLEATYFALTGRSFRTRDRRELIAFGERFARAEAQVADVGGTRHTLLASVSRAEGRRHLLDGAPAPPSVLASARPHAAVFSPDRLVLVKGPPGERRAHLDRVGEALWPARVGLRARYGQALAQRNALLARIRVGEAPESELDAWDATTAAAAAALVASRTDTTTALARAFATAAAELGLADDCELRYAPRASGAEEELRVGLGERRATDLRLGRTSWGPHLDELDMRAGGRSLRRYGSQGQQRTALLALLFAEREALMERSQRPPLMVLDDVMSELDRERRELLATRLGSAGQALVTATEASHVPGIEASARVVMPEGTRLAAAA
jgi:DNA replication and repair protein RecF